jgi:flagellar biosynthesis component FlhA
MLNWLLALINEEFESNRMLFQFLLLGGGILLTMLIYRIIRDDEEEEKESDSESEEEEEEEESSSSELVDDELLALEKENAELDEQLGKLDQDEYERGRRKRK